jgi:hypothetical protein
MKRMMGLGISNPHARVAAWLAGCGAVSCAGAIAGAAGLVVLLAV